MKAAHLDRRVTVEGFVSAEWVPGLRRRLPGGARSASADRWARYLEDAKPLSERRPRGAVLARAIPVHFFEPTVAA